MFALILLFLPVILAFESSLPHVRFQWNYINYTWPSPELYMAALQIGSYVPEHNAISGIKVWRDRAYLTVPRWKSGVPVTLASVPIGSMDGVDSPLLEPYPNWGMQNENNCLALQFVQSMEIDPAGRMWIINNGRTEIMSKGPKVLCQSRLIILDLENDGSVLLNYVFPEEVVLPNSVHLNDIVVDHEDGGYAYITDSDIDFPGLIVFSLQQKRAWKVQHESMLAKPEGAGFYINGVFFTNVAPISGIALSEVTAQLRFVYYYPLSSLELFALPTWVLQGGLLDVQNYVVHLGRKPSQSGGMTVSANGDLFLSLLGLDAVAVWDTRNTSFSNNMWLLIQDHERSQYPDSFAIDDRARLWYVANRLQNFMTDSVDVRQVNARVIVLQTPSIGYQYFPNGSAPALPDVEESTVPTAEASLYHEFTDFLNKWFSFGHVMEEHCTRCSDGQ